MKKPPVLAAQVVLGEKVFGLIPILNCKGILSEIISPVKIF